MSEEKCKAVVFIDSLGHGDLEYMPWLSDHLDMGEMDASPVYVTPVVLGSIYTGLSPTEHGMPAISRYGQAPRLRPAAPTAPELIATDDTYENVACLNLPFIVPPDVEPQGNYWHRSSGVDQTATFPPQAENILTMPAPAGELDLPGENLDLCYNLRIDHCMATFGTYRNLIAQWDLDAAFLGYRVPDSYAHWHYEKPVDADLTYRQELLGQIDRELEYLAKQAELFVFGDHGAMEMRDDGVFRINRWLIEHDFLDVTIDHDWLEKAEDYGVLDPNEKIPGKTMSGDTPGVTIHEEDSVAISDDPFSTGVTLLEGASEDEVERLIDELEAEPAIESVKATDYLFGSGPLLEECPDFYACRNEGYFVSGNLHPEPGGAEVTRTGVHHPVGVFGGAGITTPGVPVEPPEIFGYIMNWLGVDPYTVETDAGHDSGVVDGVARERLEDLGYL